MSKVSTSYVFRDPGIHGNVKMSMTFTLDDWNTIIHHLKNSEMYLTDKDYKNNFEAICWAAATASEIDDRIEKKIIKSSY